MENREPIIIPNSFEEAVNRFIGMLEANNELHYIQDNDKQAFCGITHHGVGRWIRNNWGLWQKIGGLYDELHLKGLWHADDMSGCIIDAAWCKVRGEEFDLEAEVEKYKQYWQKNGIHEEG